MNNITTTTTDLVSSIYQATPAGTERTDNRDGSVTFRLRDRFFTIGEEIEDDGSLWGWSFTSGTYATETDGSEFVDYEESDGATADESDRVLSAALFRLHPDFELGVEYIVRELDDDEPGYSLSDDDVYRDGEEGERIGMAVVEHDGEWVATLETLDLATASMDIIEEIVARKFGTDASLVTAKPVGGNVSGDTSHRNVATRSDKWTVTIR